MSRSLLGEMCALGAAFAWAVALVLFKRSGESVPPLSLSLFKNVVGVVLLMLTLAVLSQCDEARTAHRETGLTLSDLPTADLYILILSGVLGIAIADTLLFYSLNMIGVGLVTIMECVYTPAVILIAALFLSEQVEAHHFVGGAFVVSGIFLSSTHKPPPGRSRGMLLFGMALGVSAVTMMAVGIVVAKPILEEVPLIPASFVRLAAGTAALAILLAATPARRRFFSVFRPSSVWRFSLPASVLGTYLAMILWVGGFKYTDASIAAILNQTSTIIALILATLILKEPFTRRKLAAAVLAFCGVVLVTTGGSWFPLWSSIH